MKPTNEQIQEILDGAPEGAVYFDGEEYSDRNGFVWSTKKRAWLNCGHFLCGTPLELYREILELRQEVERFEAQLKERDEIIEAVAHIGVDFGYGKYELEQKHIDKARELLAQKERGDE